MNKILLITLFINHILGDFYLQSSKLADKKDKSIKGVMLHSLLYSIPFVIMLFVVKVNFNLVISIIVIGMSHFIIDSLKYVYNKIIRRRSSKDCLFYKEGFIFTVDQVVHVVTILITYYLLLANNSSIWPWIHQVASILPFEVNVVLRWCFLLLFIYKPVNIAHGKLFSSFKPSKREEIGNEIKATSKLHIAEITYRKEKNIETYGTEDQQNMLSDRDRQAGALIGFMERLIIVIFLSLQQYAAIGLVLTAKSIVRYDRISKDQEFSEYYLIGTLFSFIAALVLYYVTII